MVEISKIDRAQASRQVNPQMFIGHAYGQSLVDESSAPMQRVAAITFESGARNRWHTHTSEQVLVVIDGQGIIADRHGEHAITVGDVVVVGPGERHWHGASPGMSMTHLSILLPSTMTIDPDQD